MDRLTALIDEQNRTWRRMREIVERAENENRDFTAEERTNYDEADSRLSDIEADVRRLEGHAEREQVDRSQLVGGAGQPVAPEGEVRSPEAVAAEYREAFGAYMRRGIGNVSERHRELLEANHTDLPEARAQGGGSPEAGGFLVPPEFLNQLVEVQASYGGMLQYCNQIVTATGANLSWPTNDDTMNEGQILAENTQIAEQDVLFKTRQISAYTYTSKMVRVSWQLLNDSAFDLEGFLARKFGERLGRIYARHLLVGTGVGQPLGLLQPTRIGAGTDPLLIGATTPTGATQSIAFDNLIDLEHSIDPAYRNGGNARYGISDGTLKMVRKLKDSDGRPLWVPIPAPGFGPTINGYPYFVDNTMGAVAANGIGAVFGDFRAGMLVRIVQGVQSVRLNERYADVLQTGFFGFSRMDAKPDDPKALAALRFGPAA